MAGLRLEPRQLAVCHSEIGAGHDVTHLLSHINQNFKQSKADQILRLLRDQDKAHDKLDDDLKLLEEYDQIREEDAARDSDTLTDSSSVSDIDINEEAEEGDADNNGEAHMNMNTNADNPAVERPRTRASRSRTSTGFHIDGIPVVKDNAFTTQIDTRDISLRPKSSYVRRNQYRRPTEGDVSVGNPDAEDAETPSIRRISKSARPKSRLGRASIPLSERKIVMVEAKTLPQDRAVADKEKEDYVKSVNNMYDRFSSTRQAKRDSKRAKAFCDSVIVAQRELTNENMSVDSGGNSMDVLEEMTEVHPLVPASVSHQRPVASNDESVVHINSQRDPPESVVHRLSPAPAPHISPTTTQHPSAQHQPQYHRQMDYQQYQQQPLSQHQQQFKRAAVGNRPERQESFVGYPQSHVADPHFVRSDTVVSTATLRSERPEKSQVHLKHSSSNAGSHGRPRNPEPVSSRPIERPDIRPSTRSRRLQRRFMPQSQPHTSNVRPTSESVILARQKTEKNLIKQKSDNRPQSEKIPMNSNKMLSVAENPTQGPQTYITSKAGVTQASHVQAGFRGYDPGSRMKSSMQTRNIPGDLTLPRQGHGVASRKGPVTLMKLPPLEASLAAKKKERGLTLAQRETCV